MTTRPLSETETRVALDMALAALEYARLNMAEWADLVSAAKRPRKDDLMEMAQVMRVVEREIRRPRNTADTAAVFERIATDLRAGIAEQRAKAAQPPKVSVDGYLQHEAAYIVLRDGGRPMTVDEIVREMTDRGYPFGTYYPRDSVQRSMREQARKDGSMTYRDGKWSIVKDKIIPPLS